MVNLDAEQTGHVRTIIAQGKACGFPEHGWICAVMCAMQESTMYNLSGGDRDSVGLFQQRPSMEWGTIQECTTPTYAAQAFYLGVGGRANPGLQHVAGWESMRPGVAVQTVQRSGFPDAYDKWEADARRWVAENRGVAPGRIVTSGRINRVPIGPVPPDTGGGDPPPPDPGPVDPPPPGGGDTPPAPAPVAGVRNVRRDGDLLFVRYTDGKQEMLIPTGSNLWIAKKKIVIPPPPPDPGPTDPGPVDPGPTDPPPPGGGTPSGRWTHPLPGGVLTSGYGPRGGMLHAGLDISTGNGVGPGARGKPILACADMKITIAKAYGGGGLPDAGEYVKGHSVNGDAYSFSHFHGAPGSIAVSVGQTVAAGTKLMDEGSTGNSTAQHLHLEIWPGHKAGDFFYWGDGTPPDPRPILAAHGVNV